MRLLMTLLLNRHVVGWNLRGMWRASGRRRRTPLRCGATIGWNRLVQTCLSASVSRRDDAHRGLRPLPGLFDFVLRRECGLYRQGTGGTDGHYVTEQQR